MRRPLYSALLCASFASTGCYSGYAADSAMDPGAATTPGDDAGESSASGDPDSGDNPDDPDVPPDSQCEWDEGLPSLPMRRLTQLEYDNSVRDLFGITTKPASAFVDDSPSGGYDANDLAVSDLQARLYVDAAESIAAEVVAGPMELTDCNLSESTCVDAFVQTWGRRVFRRDLTTAERDEYRTYFEEMREDEGIDAALEHTLTAWLASPGFLYLAHRESADEPLANAYAQASRLAYFLWSSAPDDALLDRAAAGQLDDLTDLESIAREMLADPRAIDTLGTFSRQWLHVDSLEWGGSGKDTELYPQWDGALADAMDRELQAFFADVVFDGDGTVRALLEDRHAYVDDALAAVYGVQAPEGGEGWVELPQGERAGLLTRAGFLATHAHEKEGSIVKRGVIVQRQLLSSGLPPPPDNLELDPEVKRLENPLCAGCHVMIDPAGEGLHEYDAIGQWSDTPSDGVVVGVDDTPFDGGAELSSVLADSERVQRCVARQWFQFSHRRPIEAADACTLELIEQAVLDSGGDIREAIVAVAISDSFRFGVDR